MCFSASASFGISSVLLVSGAIAIKKANKLSQIPFAAIPVIFGLQQFTEGILWTALTNPQHANWQASSTFVFLFIAQVVWPFWVPFSMWLIEENTKRKKILLAIVAIGTICSSYLMYCFANYDMQASIRTYHIHYELNYPMYLVKFSGVFYFIPTVISALVSSVKKMWIMGGVNLLSFIVAKLFFKQDLVSVWCFFAAVLSALTVLVMYNLNKKE